MPTSDVKTDSLVINKLSLSQYQGIASPSETELYLIYDDEQDDVDKYIKRSTYYAKDSRLYSYKLGATEYLVCTQAGTTGATEPNWGNPYTNTTDGTAKFMRITPMM